MERAMFSATKKNQAARQTAKRRKTGRPGRPLKIGTIHSHAARREAAKERALERRRAAEGVAMPAENWPRVPRRPTPTSGPVFPLVLPGSAHVDKRGNVRSWLQLQVSWVMRRGAAYWVVVPHMFYPWSMTEEDHKEHLAAMRWFNSLSYCDDTSLPNARKPVMMEGWAIDGEAAVKAAIEAIAGLPQHVAALPINIPPTSRIRAHAARASVKSLPGNQQQPPGHMAQQATFEASRPDPSKGIR